MTAALVLPVSALAVFGGDAQCNHLEGDVSVAATGTPRASLCDAVQWGHHWLLVLVLPAIVTLLLAGLAAASGLAGRHRSLLAAAWFVGATLAFVPLMLLVDLRAYPTA